MPQSKQFETYTFQTGLSQMESSKKAKIEGFAHFNKKGTWKHLFLGLVINL